MEPQEILESELTWLHSGPLFNFFFNSAWSRLLNLPSSLNSFIGYYFKWVLRLDIKFGSIQQITGFSRMHSEYVDLTMTAV